MTANFVLPSSLRRTRSRLAIVGAVIGTRLLPAPQARNTIEALVKSGAIEGEAAEAWTKKLEIEKEVKEMRAKAEGGDGDAMYLLGVWYENGSNGLAQDMVQARASYERSAAVRCPRGLAAYGEYLLCGVGGPQDTTLGLVNATEAAHLGSNLGAFRLGEAFGKGLGVPKDPARARYWLKKATDSECEWEFDHIDDASKATGAKFLEELDAIE